MYPVDNLIREVAAIAKQQDQKLTEASAAIALGPAGLLMTFPINTPVLDLVTGETGVVIGGKRENVLVPSASDAGN